MLQERAQDVVAARSAAVDAMVRAAFEQVRPNLTVSAAGGYGRSELFPYSDVDLLLLVDRPPEASADRDSLAEFLRILWDAGLRVSQSVRTAGECCEIHEGNLELTISLLDRRFVCGNESRFEDLEKKFPKFLASQRSNIAHELCVMARSRHAKYQDTIYHLEPNIKEHPGGLRDIHTLHWLSKLKGGPPDSFPDGRDLLYSVRIELHRYYGRDNNLLNFEAQEALSDDPAAWMRSYYRNARGIFHAVTRAIDATESARARLLAQFRDWRSRVSNAEFTVSRERVLLRDPQRIQTDPSIMMRLLQFISRHQLQLAADTEQRLAAAAPAAPTWSEMRQFLAMPHSIAGLRAMQDTGLLEKTIPEWRRIDCLVVRDFYHRYTVDEHTLIAIQSLADLAGIKEGLRQRFAELLSEVDRPDLLRMALLLHDIGKGGSGDHVRESLEIAHTVLWRFGVPPDDASTILFLIEHHLDLSSVMTTRDLSDPAVAKHIADQAGTIERLKLLTLLTYADVSAVNPAAMTPWRLERLWRAYLTGHDEFTRELASERVHSGTAAPESRDRLDFLEGFPTRYLRTHSETEIEHHLELSRQGTAIELSRMDGTYRLIVIAPDRPALLASMSGALASFGVNILKAEAFSNAGGMILDTFVFSDPHRTLELNPGEADRLRDTIARAISGKLDVKQLLSKRARRGVTGRIRPSVVFNNDLSDSATLIEIVAEDRPGLLHDLTQAISDAAANIEVVLIDTEAHKALDVFYVTSGGNKLTPGQQAALRTDLLEACASPVL